MKEKKEQEEERIKEVKKEEEKRKKKKDEGKKGGVSFVTCFPNIEANIRITFLLKEKLKIKIDTWIKVDRYK